MINVSFSLQHLIISHANENNVIKFEWKLNCLFNCKLNKQVNDKLDPNATFKAMGLKT